MNKFLLQIGFADHIITELPIGKNQFVTKFQTLVDDADAKTFPRKNGRFSPRLHKLKGKITDNGFTIQRHRNILEKDGTKAIAIGVFNEQNDTLEIETKINGFRPFFIFFYAFLIFWMSTVFMAKGDLPKVFLLLWGMFMWLTSVLGIWFEVRRLRKELEKAFAYALK